MQKVVTFLENLVKIFGLVFILSYGIGFLVWNYHLSRYGFFETNILQSRFLSAGLLFLLFFSIAALVLYLIVIKCVKSDAYLKYFYYLLFLFFIYFYIFGNYIFPSVPQSFGGTRPFIKWLIADSAEIKFLDNFEIEPEPNGQNESVQTKPICEIYNNNDIIIVGATSDDGISARILAIKKDIVKGYQAVPPGQVDSVMSQRCDGFFPRL